MKKTNKEVKWGRKEEKRKRVENEEKKKKAKVWVILNNRKP